MNLKDAAANLNQAHPEDTLHPLYTPWGELLMRSGSYDDILPEYPRPQMKRTDYHMLNGLWEYNSNAVQLFCGHTYFQFIIGYVDILLEADVEGIVLDTDKADLWLYRSTLDR